MRITYKELKQLISEQVSSVLLEQTGSSATGTDPRKQALIQSAIEACNLIFQPGAPYSFHRHLTRLKRGLQTGDARIANYELAAHNAHVTLLIREKFFAIINMFAEGDELNQVRPWRRGMPAQITSGPLQRAYDAELGRRLINVISQLRNALYIEGVNRVITGRDGSGAGSMLGWPTDISRINTRLKTEMINRIDRALAILNSESNFCELVADGPPSTPTSTQRDRRGEGDGPPAGWTPIGTTHSVIDEDASAVARGGATAPRVREALDARRRRRLGRRL